MVDVNDDDVKEPVQGLTINDVETEEEEVAKSDNSSDVAYYEEYKRAGEAKLKRDEEDRLIAALPDLKEKVEGRDEDELRRALAIEKQKLEQIKTSPEVRWDDKKQGELRDEEREQHEVTGSSTPGNAGTTSYPSSTTSDDDDDFPEDDLPEEEKQRLIVEGDPVPGTENEDDQSTEDLLNR